MAKRSGPTPADTPEQGNVAADTAIDTGAAQATADQNTEAPQDSPEGGAPAGAEGAASASGENGALAGAEEGRVPFSDITAMADQPTSTAEMAVDRVVVAPLLSEAVAPEGAGQTLANAIARVGLDSARILPTSPKTIFPPRRGATVVSAIEHHGYPFKAGASIPLTEAEFTGLKDTGALLETNWDELEEI